MKNRSSLIVSVLQGLNGALFGIVLIVLTLRFALRVFGANTSPFVSWIYTSSQELLYPFRGIFEQLSLAEPSGSVLELSTLFAILIYGLLYTLIQAGLNYLDRVSTQHTVS